MRPGHALAPLTAHMSRYLVHSLVLPPVNRVPLVNPPAVRPFSSEARARALCRMFAIYSIIEKYTLTK